MKIATRKYKFGNKTVLSVPVSDALFLIYTIFSRINLFGQKI